MIRKAFIEETLNIGMKEYTKQLNSKFQLVIPIELREAINIDQNSTVQFSFDKNLKAILIKKVKIVQDGE